MPVQEVFASIITIGDELLIGQTIDTNSAFIAKALNGIGVWLKRRVAIADSEEAILQALDTESGDCQIIIITGGLGPTSDDITKPALLQYFGGRMVQNDAVLENVTGIFSRLNRPLLPSNISQAQVPEGCTVLMNTRGTAPGMWFEKNNCVFVSLPGVPHEMEGLVTGEVVPRLLQRFSMPVILHRTLVTVGKGESEMAEVIQSVEKKLPPHIKLAYLPNYGMVKLRLTAKGGDAPALQQELDGFANELKKLVAEWLVTDKDSSLAEVVATLLTARGQTLATAESCTGGYIAHLVTQRAGASAFFLGSLVTYANPLKEKLLQVKPDTLQLHGAVSEETVREMVAGALELTGAHFAIATSGIMGPDGGTAHKPVGTVWVAVGNKEQSRAVKYSLRFNRKKNIEITAQYALNQLRLFILEHGQ